MIFDDFFGNYKITKCMVYFPTYSLKVKFVRFKLIIVIIKFIFVSNNINILDIQIL